MSGHVLFDDAKALASSLKEKAGLSPSYASELAHGKRLPSLTLAARIEDKLGIPAAAWTKREVPQDAAA